MCMIIWFWAGAAAAAMRLSAQQRPSSRSSCAQRPALSASRGLQVEQREPGDSPAARALYAGWVGGPPGSRAARRLLHTGYHRREKPAAAAAADW